ncbi:IS3 family transposase [Mycoplasmopsis phocirhinis]|uniref:IS3 family transposase n=1 Tax=Mycoplasmopsis phocirhinis TaxID=142650 RepID=A0A4P6MSV7_9BACT|nr:IS3 family transposase [Mycoplasmopsis phocirhinis]QBF34971.1 IS3 family transposase [Mycoplasmopsis phocirhinis]
MSRHLKMEEFDLIFEVYQKHGKSQAIKTLWNISPKTKLVKKKYLAVRIAKIIKYYNLGVKEKLLTKKGKDRKPGSGRPRKEPDFDWDIFDRNDLIEIAKRYYEITNQKPKKEKKEEAKNLKIQFIKLALFFSLCRQTISNAKVKQNTEKTIPHSKIIVEAFEANKGRFGRKKLSIYIFNQYNIHINDRTLGRYLNQLNLKCKLRQKRKRKEIKNTKCQILNTVQRDYNDSQNRNIFATDVSYINAPKDVRENHVYLSAIINHKSKKIVGFRLSKNNNLDFVLDNINDIQNENFDKFIVHSDHGFQYTNQEYINKIIKFGGTVSMSRVGNSLDNREIEYWFGVIKTELLNDLDYTKITFDELNDKIKEYIFWYNNERIQSNLGWKTPQQIAMAFAN